MIIRMLGALSLVTAILLSSGCAAFLLGASGTAGYMIRKGEGGVLLVGEFQIEEERLGFSGKAIFQDGKRRQDHDVRRLARHAKIDPTPDRAPADRWADRLRQLPRHGRGHREPREGDQDVHFVTANPCTAFLVPARMRMPMVPTTAESSHRLPPVLVALMTS